MPLFVFQQGMMAVRIDVVPSTGFPGMPFNGQRACFLLKNMTTFDQTVKELHTRGKTKVENFNFYVSKKNVLKCAHIFVLELLQFWSEFTWKQSMVFTYLTKIELYYQNDFIWKNRCTIENSLIWRKILIFWNITSYCIPFFKN